MPEPTIVIRERTDADLPGVADLLVETHHSHAYPVILLDDMAAWGAGTGVLAAWVAVDPAEPDRVLGHVALTAADPEELPTPQWVAATGLAPADLGVVRRLLVSAAAHRRGIGRMLLATAVDAARQRDLRPVLDMAVNLREAAQLYESAGFVVVGRYDLDLTPYFTAGQTSFEIDGRQTTVLPVVTWIGPDATAR